MPTIENHTEHAFEFPRGDNRANLISIPPARPKAAADGTEVVVPGQVTVTDEVLAEMRKHYVAKNWFGPRSLVVTDAPPKKDAKAA